MIVVLFVCPDCGAWAESTVNSHPQYSAACAMEAHPPAIATQFVPRIPVVELVEAVTARLGELEAVTQR